MLNKSKVFKILSLKESIKGLRMSNLEALSSLDKIINEYSNSSDISNGTIELQLYLNELQKLKKINDKAQIIENEVSKLKKANLDLLDEILCLRQS